MIFVFLSFHSLFVTKMVLIFFGFNAQPVLRWQPTMGTNYRFRKESLFSCMIAGRNEIKRNEKKNCQTKLLILLWPSHCRFSFKCFQCSTNAIDKMTKRIWSMGSIKTDTFFFFGLTIVCKSFQLKFFGIACKVSERQFFFLGLFEFSADIILPFGVCKCAPAVYKQKMEQTGIK